MPYLKADTFFFRSISSPDRFSNQMPQNSSVLNRQIFDKTGEKLEDETDTSNMLCNLQKDSFEMKVPSYDNDCNFSACSTSSAERIARPLRGRPKQSTIPDLIQCGVTSNSPFKCHVCQRAFRLNKNLRTHLATHSDSKSHVCLYPGCDKSFKQSGQLKTHFYLHSKEKPYKCLTCFARYRHQNRRCKGHPFKPLIFEREHLFEIQSRVSADENISPEQRLHLLDYFSKIEEHESKKFINELLNDDSSVAKLLTSLKS